MKSTSTAGSRPSTSSGANTSATTTGKAATAKSGKQQKPMLEIMFLDMLKDIYWAEDHLVTKLAVMENAATTDELQEAFEDHRLLTQKHKARLEKVFKMLGENPEAKKCEAMEGLTKEAESIIKETTEGSMTRDAALIIAAQKVEHYEIATYGSLVQIARTLGYERAADLLEKTLWEEEDTDRMLTDIAETDINPMADDEDDDEQTEEEETTTGSNN